MQERWIIQDPEAPTGWWRFDDLQALAVAADVDQVPAALEAVEDWISSRGWAVGYIAYEAAPAFESAFTVQPSASKMPLLWFALCRECRPYAPPTASAETDSSSGAWQLQVSADEYISAVGEIRKQIAAGNTYQVNYTVRLESEVANPWPWFLSRRRLDRRSCQAFLEIPTIGDSGPWTIASFSPELFFRLSGRHIHSRPMKGTARPGRDLEETQQIAEELKRSEKNRAENVMIVDMIRNDLGRIADPGSVDVPSLFEVEHHPTVVQMTSTVEAKIGASFGSSFSAILQALFPCASITGAPKIAASKIIADLERRPRGVYTGAIGFAGPDRQARFNVAIRTAVIDHRTNSAEYGVGGGIVWDSVAEEEFRECETKATIVRRGRPDFDLLETLLWEPSRGPVLLDSHAERQRSSARHFGLASAPELATTVVRAVGAHRGPTPSRLRLISTPNGTAKIEVDRLNPLTLPIRLAFARLGVDDNDPRLWHKTTDRTPYESDLADHESADDVLFVNSDGEVTESSFANLVIQIDGRWLTPPRTSGCLNGTLRAELLAAGVIEEESVTPQIVERAERVFLINSVRGWIPATIFRTASVR